VPLKRLKNGTYEIKNEKDAIRAVELGYELKEALRDDMNNATELHRAAARYYQAQSDDSRARLSELYIADGVRATLVQRFSRFWIGLKSDMPPDAPPEARTLRAICGNRKIRRDRDGKLIPLWNFVTKRVPDPEKIEMAINLGYLDEDEASKAFLEKPQAPYFKFSGGER
jgi:hypothetical protein